MQSERMRQRKREQKRLRREEKHRTIRAPPGRLSAVLPPSIFCLLLDYAAPLIEALPESADAELIDDFLMLAAVVWNAVVEENGDGEEAARKLIADMNAKVLFPPPDWLVLWLAHRKATDFRDDARLMRGAEFERDIDRLYELVFGDSSAPASGRDERATSEASRSAGAAAVSEPPARISHESIPQTSTSRS
jgi:hypothetical protein